MTASRDLILFDCDGVLVDSEVIAAEVLAKTLQQEGLPIDVEQVYSRFLGRSRKFLEANLLADFAYRLSPEVSDTIRALTGLRMERELRPIAGIGEVLAWMKGRPVCVASSSGMQHIRRALRITALLHYFEPHIFSATMVENGKPAPDLFLHAARAMGATPADCIVVEDSPAGISAAKSAGMRVFAFIGGSHAGRSGLHSAVAALVPDAIFDDMLRLPQLLAEDARRL